MGKILGKIPHCSGDIKNLSMDKVSTSKSIPRNFSELPPVAHLNINKDNYYKLY